MKTSVWVGHEPNGYEAKVLREIRDAFEAAGVTCHLMANFMVGGHEIDLLVVKPNAIFLVELKMVWGAVKGAINGDWTVEKARGKGQLKGGCNGNPYQQMLTQYRVLTEWLEAHKHDFLNDYDAKITHFRPVKRTHQAQAPVKLRSLLVFYPALPKGSELQLDWKVEPVGFSDLIQILVNETSPRVNLTDTEIAGIAKLLSLRNWSNSAAGQAEPVIPEKSVVLDVRNQPMVSSAAPRSPIAQWRCLQLSIMEALIVQLTHYRNRIWVQMQTVER